MNQTISYLAADDQELLESLLLAMRLHWARGERRRVEELLKDHPNLQAEANCVLDLIYQEVVLREACNETATLEEYAGRFPTLRDELQNLFAVHQAIGTEQLHETAVPMQTSSPSEDFEIIEELGKGGAGVVYKARQKSLNRPVALKMIRQDGRMSSEQAERFRAEALAVAQLQHPNMVQIHEVGEHNGFPFLVLEFISGGTLAKSLGGRPQPPRTAAGTVETLARAVHYAHERGLVHRDLKPANVLVAEDGRLKVTDFGLVKHLASRTIQFAETSDSQDTIGQTRAGTVAGTPSYMAPEQASGKIDEIGPPADIYALGAILYEMLTGRPPFKGTSVAETLRQVQNEEPVPPRQLQPAVPRDLDTICLTCLQKERSKRYHTAMALADDLQAFQAGRPIQARPVGSMERTLRWCKRNPVIASLCAAAAAFLFFALAAGVWAYFEKSFALVQAGKNEQLETEKRKLAEKALDNEKTLREVEEKARKKETALRVEVEEQRDLAVERLYLSDIRLAYRALAANEIFEVKRLLQRHVPKDGQTDLRQWEWYYLLSECHRDLITLGTAKSSTDPWYDEVLSLNWRPDGKQIVSVSRAGRVVAWNSHDGKKVKTLAGYVNRGHAAWSSDGKKFAMLDRRNLATVLDAESWQVLAHLPKLPGDQLARALDAKPVALLPPRGAREIVLTIVDAATGKQLQSLRRPLEKGERSPYAPAVVWRADGNRLASSNEQWLTIWDRSAGSALRTWKCHTLIDSMTWSADGKRLAAGYRDGVINIWNAQSGEIEQTFRGTKSSVTALEWNRQGLLAAAGKFQPTITVWDPGGSNEPRVFRGHYENVNAVAWSADGKRLASASQDGTSKIWDVATDYQKIVLPRGFERVRPEHCTWSPDGDLLAIDCSRAVFVWDFQESRIVCQLKRAKLPKDKDRYRQSAAWCADGKRLAVTDGDGRINIVNTDNWQTDSTLEGHIASISLLAWDPQGKQLASTDHDGNAVIWDSMGKIRWRFKSAGGGLRKRIQWSGDGVRLFLAHAHKKPGQTLQVFDVQNGKLMLDLPNHDSSTPLPCGPDVKRVVVPASQFRAVKVIDADSGKTLFTTIPGKRTLGCAVWSPQGKWLATAGIDRVVNIWDGQTGRLMQTLRGHTNDVRYLAWSPNGRRLLSTGLDNTTRLWDPARGQEILKLPGADSVAWSPDGKRITRTTFGGVNLLDAAFGYEK